MAVAEPAWRWMMEWRSEGWMMEWRSEGWMMEWRSEGWMMEWRSEGWMMEWRSEGWMMEWRSEGWTMEWRSEGWMMEWRSEGWIGNHVGEKMSRLNFRHQSCICLISDWGKSRKPKREMSGFGGELKPKPPEIDSTRRLYPGDGIGHARSVWSVLLHLYAVPSLLGRYACPAALSNLLKDRMVFTFSPRPLSP
jgi:hypothetical protein